ncbi:MAG: integrase arm-type DNA-binding domain-containing protein [Proteobacteria bacterium]|nr:integrase arm-type DNA-binding domain-containing protein [Pseudomonadota bacterium]
MKSKARKSPNVLLTDSKIRNTKPDPDRQIKLADNQGLYLLIKSNGSRGWRWKYYFGGKEKCISFGVYPAVSLREARKRRDAAREQLQKGLDPVAARRAAKAAERSQTARGSTFKSVADAYLKLQAAKTSTATQYKQKWFLSLLQPLHKRPITKITTPEIVAGVKAVEADIQKKKKMAPAAGIETAHRCASLAKRVFDHACNAGIITDGRNPAATVHKVLLPVETTNRPAITDPVEIGKLLNAIDHYSGKSPVVQYALKIIPYIFVRPFEQRHLRWSWIDFNDSTISIPGNFMKTGTDHIVPLAPQVAKLFSELKEITGDGQYVFPGVSRSRAMSENALTSALRRMGYTGAEQTWHGFRTIASTRLNELGYAPDLIEAQLAHKLPGGKVRDAYNRAEYVDQRRAMMAAYADHLDELREKFWMG